MVETSDNNNVSVFKKAFSAILYCSASILIIFTNKIVLTSYSFPSYQILAIVQLYITIVLLAICSFLNILKLPEISLSNIREIMPLPAFFTLNLLFGLASAKSLNIPMLVALRQFSVLMTMFGEMYILKNTKTRIMQLSVYIMVLGSLIAAYNDLAFDLYGYVYIMFNNLFTSAAAISMKQKLSKMSFDEFGLLYFNSLFAIIPIICLSLFTNEYSKLDSFVHWNDYGFWFFFILNLFMGILLNYSVMLCTNYNSALTTAVFGCLKNIVVTYGGMFVGGDYIFTLYNFLGLTISTSASVFHSYLTFKRPSNTSNNSNINMSPSQHNLKLHEEIIELEENLLSKN